MQNKFFIRENDASKFIAAAAFAVLIFSSGAASAFECVTLGGACEVSSKHPLSLLRISKRDGSILGNYGRYEDYHDLDAAGINAVAQIACNDYALSHSDDDHAPLNASWYTVDSCTVPYPNVGGGVLLGMTLHWTDVNGIRHVDPRPVSEYGLLNTGCASAPNAYYGYIGDDLQCYCPTGLSWRADLQTCQIIQDRLFSKKPATHDSCDKKSPGVADPIYPLTGTKKQAEPLNITVGHESLRILYDTVDRLPTTGDIVNGSSASFSSASANVTFPGTYAFGDGAKIRFTSPAGVQRILSGGGAWRSSLHRSLNLSGNGSGGFSVQARRGYSSDDIGFQTTNSYDFQASSPEVPEKLTRGLGSLLYLTDLNGNVETYDAGDDFVHKTLVQAPVQRIDYAEGGFLTFTYSDANTAASIAPIPGLLIRVQDHNGRFVLFQYEQPSQPADVTLYPRIKQMSDTTGQLTTFGYNAYGNLSAIHWPNGTSRQFLYELTKDYSALEASETDRNWAMTGIIDEKGNRIMTDGYSAEGYVISNQGANGVNATSISWTTPPSIYSTLTTDPGTNRMFRDFLQVAPTGVTVSMPNGQVNSLGAATVSGTTVATGWSQPAGSGCSAASSAIAYDTVGRILSEDDFTGMRTCYAYDGNSNKKVTVKGLSNTSDCATILSDLGNAPATARITYTTWDSYWHRPVQVKSAGALNTVVYSGKPDPFNPNTAASCTTAANLPTGQALPLVCKTVDQATIDAPYVESVNPSVDPYASSVKLLLRGEGADGATFFTDSSPNPKDIVNRVPSQLVETRNEKFVNGSASMYFNSRAWLSTPKTSDYDFDGDFTIDFWAWKDPDGSPTNNGGILSNAAGASPTNGWMIYLDRNEFGFYYNGAAGNDYIGAPMASGYADAQWHHYAISRTNGVMRLFFDGVKKLEKADTTNFLGSGADLAIGADVGAYALYGNLDDVRITKGAGRYTSNFMPSRVNNYSVDSNVPARVTQYTYDAFGRVLTSKDSLNRTTSYTYYSDTAFTGTDPNAIGHTVGDLITLTNPAGFITTFNAYDKAGRILKMTDPKGIVTDMTYTPRGWANTVTTTAPGQSARVTTYAYDFVGQLTGVTNPDGSTLAYTYDAAHRLIGATDAKGNSFTYTLDNMGNRIKEDIKDPTGILQRSINRSFDALNRLQQVSGAVQ